MISLRQRSEPPSTRKASRILPNGHLLVSSEGIQNRGAEDAARHFRIHARRRMGPRTLPCAAGSCRRRRAQSRQACAATLPSNRSRSRRDGKSILHGDRERAGQDGEPADLRTWQPRAHPRVRAAGRNVRAWPRMGVRHGSGRARRLPAGFFIQGLVELLALGDGELLALERSYVEEQDAGRAIAATGSASSGSR